MERPEMPTLSVGMELLVLPGQSGRKAPEPVPVTVTKIGRKYATVTEIRDSRYPFDWQFVLSTGLYFDLSNRYVGYSPKLLTSDQLAYDRRVEAAWEVIHAAGLQQQLSGRLDNGGLVLAVAEAIEKYRAGS
jgi:hypothetical protein